MNVLSETKHARCLPLSRGLDLWVPLPKHYTLEPRTTSSSGSYPVTCPRRSHWNRSRTLGCRSAGRVNESFSSSVRVRIPNRRKCIWRRLGKSAISRNTAVRIVQTQKSEKPANCGLFWLFSEVSDQRSFEKTAWRWTQSEPIPSPSFFPC